jgi:uncharacterized membrane protein
MNTLVLRRQGIAILALIGLLIAADLSLFRLGFIGQLACTGDGGCAAVQLSPWSRLLGVPVPYIGVVAYGTILTFALMGSRPSHTEGIAIARALFGLGLTALAFAAYNTFAEAFLIRAFCPWCIACASAAVGICLLALPEAHHLRAGPQPGVPVGRL